MTTARTAMHYLVMTAFVCVTCLSAPAANAKSTPKQPKLTCLDTYNKATVTAAILDNKAKVIKVSATPAPTLSAQDLKNSSIQAALRAQLLKVALVALSKLPQGKACDAIIAKIDAKFSRS